jgi:hypothetical protein
MMGAVRRHRTQEHINYSAAPERKLVSLGFARPDDPQERGADSSESDLAGGDEYVESVVDPERRALITNAIAVGLLISSGVASAQFFVAEAYTPPGFKRISTQFIAALGDPQSNQGTNAKEWGLWRADPGPRGVWLNDYETNLVKNDGIAPAGWKFDLNDWWLEEHGLIMEAPAFGLKPGRYLVTGARTVTTGLTIDANGSWKLDDDHKLYDVTHLPCRSARYYPSSGGEGGPWTARRNDFPVRPGAEMPAVPGCDKQDYAVLFVVGKAV